jgi:hypothetical protein
MTASKKLRLGTRGSLLARWQAEWVAGKLQSHGVDVEIVPIVTSGDRHQHWAIESLGGAGVFTKEIQMALLAHEVDLAVHSMKDLPTQCVPGLGIAAVPKRGAGGRCAHFTYWTEAAGLTCRSSGGDRESSPGSPGLALAEGYHNFASPRKPGNAVTQIGYGPIRCPLFWPRPVSNV